MLISHKADLRARNIIGHKREYCIMIEKLILQKDMTILNMDRLKNSASKYKKQNWIELKREIYNPVLLGDINNGLSVMNRKAGRKLIRIYKA